jgi:hypothetical protein
MKPCIDTATDPDNCGKCGNRCGSVALVQGQMPGELAVDATNIYWANYTSDTQDATLTKMPLRGGAPVILASDRDIGDIAVDATNVYWTSISRGTVTRVPIDGGTPTQIASGEPRPFHIAVDAQSVYWSTIGTTECPDSGLACQDGGMMRKAALDGSNPKTLAANVDLPGDIAVVGRNVYWTAPGGNIMHGAIFRVPVDGGTPVALVSNIWGIHYAFAVTATNLYWIQTRQTDGGGGESIFTKPIQGGSITELARAGGQPLVSDGGNLYFLDQSRIMKLSQRGGDPVPLTDFSSAQPEALVADAANVYWSTYDGRIMTLNAPTCSAGECACPAEQSLCLGACVDLKADEANCGACGNTCASGVLCVNGHCGP